MEKKVGLFTACTIKKAIYKMSVLANDFALSHPISKAATSGNYNGYVINSDKYVKMANKKSNRVYAEVMVEKGGDKKEIIIQYKKETLSRRNNYQARIASFWLRTGALRVNVHGDDQPLKEFILFGTNGKVSWFGICLFNR